jgi:hypothetical protein
MATGSLRIYRDEADMSSDDDEEETGPADSRKRPPGLFLRLHPAYRAALQVARRRHKRTVIGEVMTALEEYFKTHGIPFTPPPEEEAAEEG